MRHNVSMRLLAVQMLLVAALYFMDRGAQPPFGLRAVGLAAVLLIACVVMLAQVRGKARLQEAEESLQRAVKGNWVTRLLANEDKPWNEFIFAVNALIEQLEETHVRSVRSEAARKSLLSNISHDIRTPLTSVIGYVDALLDNIPASAAERTEYLNVVAQKARVLKHLLDEIFQLAKLDADDLPLLTERLDLAELAREAVIGYLPEMRRKQVELHARLPEEACPVIADKLGLQRVLHNLIRNALQYGACGKVLGIELTAEPAAYRLIVWDLGPGLTEQEAAQVFDRMYRADRSRNASQGSGLGLAIAKALVEKHGGDIWVDSRPGERTVFGLSLPRGAEAQRR